MMIIELSEDIKKLLCVTCGKELTWETAIGYIPPHKSWVCWFYCKECYEKEDSKDVLDAVRLAAKAQKEMPGWAQDVIDEQFWDLK